MGAYLLFPSRYMETIIHFCIFFVTGPFVDQFEFVEVDSWFRKLLLGILPKKFILYIYIFLRDRSTL